MDAKAPVGIVGLGLMGSAIASRLVEAIRASCIS